MPRAPLGSHRQAHALLAGVIALVACTWPHPASAQHGALEAPALVNASLAALLSSSEPFVRSTPPRVGTIDPLRAERLAAGSPSRPAALPALYISFAVLQGLDAHSTLTAVSAGGREVNPAVRGLRHPARFVRGRKDRRNGGDAVPDGAPLEKAPHRRRGADGGGQHGVWRHRGAQLSRPALTAAPAPLLPNPERAGRLVLLAPAAAHSGCARESCKSATCIL